MRFWRSICTLIIGYLSLGSLLWGGLVASLNPATLAVGVGDTVVVSLVLRNTDASDSFSHFGGAIERDGTVIHSIPAGTVSGGSSTSYSFSLTLYDEGTVSVTALPNSPGDFASAVAVMTVSMKNAINPETDSELAGMVAEQTALAERIALLQTGSINSRLERIRGSAGKIGDSVKFSFSDDTPVRYDEPEIGSVLFGSDDALASLVAERVILRPWSFWGESVFNTGTTRRNSGSDHTTLSMTAGADRFITDDLSAGFALGYTRDDTDIGDYNSNSTGNAYTAALYGVALLPAGMYVDGSLGFTHMSMRLRRGGSGDYSSGDRDARQYFASVRTGYDFRRNSFLLSPFSRLDISSTSFDAYEENGGANPLRYDKSDVNLMSLTAGVRGEYVFKRRWGSLVPSAGLEYTHNFRDTVQQKTGFLDEVGAFPYTTRTQALSTNQLGATLGLEAKFKKGVTLGGEYREVFARSGRERALGLRFAREW